MQQLNQVLVKQNHFEFQLISNFQWEPSDVEPGSKEATCSSTAVILKYVSFFFTEISLKKQQQIKCY